MKKLITSLLLTAIAGLSLDAAVTLPYTSNMYVDVSQMDDGWTSSNDTRKGQGWEYDRDNTGSALSTPGTSSAAYKPYDLDYDANCWMFSPAVDLKAGGNYTVGVWAKTKGIDDENFKICYGSEASASAMTTIVFDKSEFKNPDDYVFVSGTVSPETDMTVYFGIHCYSPANHNVLSLTGFSISDGNGSTTPSEPDEPEPGEAMQLPFTYEFNSSANFAKDWIVGYGADAGVQQNWKINEYSGWAVFDVAQNEKENNWVISPELNFSEAGEYALIYTGLITGKLEFLIGTSTTGLEDYRLLATQEISGSYDNDVVYNMPFEVTEPGNYRIAVRACADPGTFMGYRMVSLKVRSDKPVPAIVNDLTATADADDALSVALCWTNPSTDHLGKDLASISKIELYRNSEMIKDDFLILTPGTTNAWLDEPADAGVYSYHVVVYNENGTADATPVEVSAGYVGRPVGEMPYSVSDSDPQAMMMFTSVDANSDGVKWEYHDSENSWDREMIIETEDPAEFDDYLVSPYLHLAPGYYKLYYDLTARGNSMEIGYTTDRHNPQESFVKLTEFTDWQEYYCDGSVVMVVETEGDYALCLHAVGLSSSPSNREISLTGLSLNETKVLPATVSGIKAIDNQTAEGFDVLLSWINPSIDNAGLPLPADEALKIIIRRDGDVVATLEGEDYKVGAKCSWTDKVDHEGDYTYSVVAEGINGASEDDAPEVDVHVCPVLTLPYTTEDFSEWIIPSTSSWYKWEIDESTNHAVWNQSYVWSFNYSIYTPYLKLDETKEYLLEATFDGSADEMSMALVSSPKINEDAAVAHHEFTLPVNVTDHKISLKLRLTDASAVSAYAEEDAAEQTSVNVASGKLMLGFRPKNTGKVTLKKFALSELISTGIENVTATEGNAIYADGKVIYPEVCRITVVDINGRVLLSTEASQLSLDEFTGIVLVSAPGYKTMKIALR